MNYYNEFDPHAAQWLRHLIEAGAIPPGIVDTRSIEDVTPDELSHYTQCHFFAGIGGWSHALNLAGWPHDRPVWTGSCPCQPFSTAGKGAGFADERHLWPAWQHLIARRSPSVVFGEQVGGKAADAWIDLVHADMEGMGYAFGCVPFPAASVGAPHIRDRNYWAGVSGGLADTDQNGRSSRRAIRSVREELHAEHGGAASRMAGTTGKRWQRRRASEARNESATVERPKRLCAAGARPGPTNDPWRDADWLRCRDGKWRPVEPGSHPLAYGVSGRVGLLRGYGNAIVPQAAAEFVMAAMHSIEPILHKQVIA